MSGRIRNRIRVAMIIFMVLLVVCVSGSASAAEREAAQDLPLQYDDYYTFEGASEVSLPEGADAITADGTTIHAGAVTKDPVPVTVLYGDSEAVEYAVTVNRAQLNFVLIDGQSNATGDCGRYDKAPICPDKGKAYLWKNDQMLDLTETFRDPQGGSVGFHPALAAEWYALTGEKTLFLNIARSGCPIEFWDSEGYTRITVQRIAEVLAAIDESRYEIVRTGYYWMQGEANAFPDIVDGVPNWIYLSTPEYQSAFEAIHKAYIDALTIPGVPAPYGGILPIRSGLDFLGYYSISEYCGVRAAQQALSNQYMNLFMASVAVDECRRTGNLAYSFVSDVGYSVSVRKTRDLFDLLHFSQSGYDIMGLEAADNIYKGWVKRVRPAFVYLKGYRALKHYFGNSTIYVEDNVCYRGNQKPELVKAAQIVAIPYPSYAMCGDLSMVLRDERGKTVTGIMEDNGYIPDYTMITEPLSLTVTVNGASSKYVLTGKDLPEYEPVEVVKAPNPLKIRVKTKTFKRKRLKRAKTFRIGAFDAAGIVTYSLSAKAGRVKIKVSSEGKVTVPKKCRRGTYTITVRAAGNENYKPGKKTVTIRVR